MRQKKNEAIEHHDCPVEIAEELRLAGGSNRFGEPNFRVVWGYNRIVSIFGNWQDFEQYKVKMTDRLTGFAKSRVVTRLKSEVIETRQVPKYLPGNCWHLEMWRPPEEYGSPEQWDKLGQEHDRASTLHTAGEFPSRGEYELCYPLTDDGTPDGQPIPLIGAVVSEIVRMIRTGREQLDFQRSKALIEQREKNKEERFVQSVEEKLRSGLPAFHGNEFVTRNIGKGGIVVTDSEN